MRKQIQSHSINASQPSRRYTIALPSAFLLSHKKLVNLSMLSEN